VQETNVNTIQFISICGNKDVLKTMCWKKLESAQC
jgi:hypothetical protein